MQILVFETPRGWMAAAWSGHGLKALALPVENPAGALEKLAGELRVAPSLLPSPARDPGPAGVLLEEIERYFSGEKVSFSSPVDWTEYTPFQRLVLEIVKRIPYGEVSSYGRVAGEAGAPRAARAVGGVMRSNRTPLVVPCHRVLAADGSLGGFTGGLEMKRYLLNLERASLRQN